MPLNEALAKASFYTVKEFKLLTDKEALRKWEEKNGKLSSLAVVKILIGELPPLPKEIFVKTKVTY